MLACLGLWLIVWLHGENEWLDGIITIDVALFPQVLGNISGRTAHKQSAYLLR